MHAHAQLPSVKLAVLACCVLILVLAPIAATSAEKRGKSSRAAPKKIEKLSCKRGTEDNHARIAVQLADGKVQEFAYYSIWKPRTCSLHSYRGDAYSRWREFNTVTTVTLAEENGAVLVEHSPDKYHFIFRDIDRMRYCGAEGKINGTLTVLRGKSECVVAGVLDDDPSKPIEPARAIDTAESKPVEPARTVDPAQSKPVEPARTIDPAEIKPVDAAKPSAGAGK